MILYRYTDLNNLALILKNRKLRLSSLNDLDDIFESKTEDMGIFGHYVFVSCWTDLKEESLPFWHMYTPNMSGVRIGLPSPYLKIYNEQPILQEKGFKYSGGKSYIPFNQRHGHDYFVVSTDLIKIEYTNDQKKLNPIIHTKGLDGADSYAFGKLGKYKRTQWSFQSEWRFKANIVPSSPPPENFEDYKNEEVYLPMINAATQVARKKELNLKEFFLEIDDNSFTNMKIMLGPKHKSGDVEIVNSLKKTYNPTAEIEISKLSGEIK